MNVSYLEFLMEQSCTQFILYKLVTIDFAISSSSFFVFFQPAVVHLQGQETTIQVREGKDSLNFIQHRKEGI